MRYASLYERLCAQVEVAGECGCWTWTGPTRRHGGGPRPAVCIRTEKGPRQFNAARLMTEIFHGPIGTHEASHLCEDNWMCINPDHLVPETHLDNIRRRDGRPVPIPRHADIDCDVDPWAGTVGDCPWPDQVEMF